MLSEWHPRARTRARTHTRTHARTHTHTPVPAALLLLETSRGAVRVAAGVTGGVRRVLGAAAAAAATGVFLRGATALFGATRSATAACASFSYSP